MIDCKSLQTKATALKRDTSKQLQTTQGHFYYDDSTTIFIKAMEIN